MIFHIRKVYVSVSNYFFLMLAFVIITNKIKTFMLCFFALIIHEIGHIITVYVLKEKINIFYILSFGFCCRLKNHNNISKDKMLKILFAGPAASFIAAVFLFLWTKEFAMINLIIGIFNMLPIGNLDGNQIIKQTTISIQK